MRFRVMSWNLAGAKLLKKLGAAGGNRAAEYIESYRKAWQESVQPVIGGNMAQRLPDIILLQECIGFAVPAGADREEWPDGDKILGAIFEKYHCFFFPALSSHENPHPAKWEKQRNRQDPTRFIPDEVEIQQGYGICIKDATRLRKLWITEPNTLDRVPKVDEPREDEYKKMCFEVVNTTTGLYLGGRDTEPRLAVLGRLLLGEGDDARYINFLNVHLTTLKNERQGNLELNRRAGLKRRRQLDLILDHVISAYQDASETYRVGRKTAPGGDDVWIIGGDFNAIPQSDEIRLMKQMGFVDGNPNKTINDLSDGSLANKVGTKWSLRKDDKKLPPVEVDYIMCGLEMTSFAGGELKIFHHPTPLRARFENTDFETDHACLIATFEI